MLYVDVSGTREKRTHIMRRKQPTPLDRVRNLMAVMIAEKNRNSVFFLARSKSYKPRNTGGIFGRISESRTEVNTPVTSRGNDHRRGTCHNVFTMMYYGCDPRPALSASSCSTTSLPRFKLRLLNGGLVFYYVRILRQTWTKYVRDSTGVMSLRTIYCCRVEKYECYLTPP